MDTFSVWVQAAYSCVTGTVLPKVSTLGRHYGLVLCLVADTQLALAGYW